MITEWMDRFVEFAATWMSLVLLATWRALPILLLVTGIGLAFRRKLSPSLHVLLLTIVVVRLLMPISIGSPLSLHKPIDSWFSSDSEESVNPSLLRGTHDLAYGILPNAEAAETQSIPSQAPVQASFSIDDAWQLFYIVALVIVISVSLWLLLRSVFSHIRFAQRLQSCRLLDDQPLIDLLLRECDSLAVGRRPTLREVQSLAAPAVFGLFRQTICLPPGLSDTLSEQQFRWVIRHELAHIRRRDIAVAIIASIAGVFHWFNPIVWLIISRLRAGMEAAADRLALQSLSQNEVSAYGELLLRFAQDSITAKKSPTLGLISFASGRHLKQRVELLMLESKPISLSARFLSAVLVGAIALVGLTDATETIDSELPDVHLVSSDSTELKGRPLLLEPISGQEAKNGDTTFVETYDVTAIFETMPKSLKVDEKSPLEQLTTWIPIPPWMKEKLHIEGETLSAELSASQHQLLKQTLDFWKDGEPEQIFIEARIIQTNIQTASSIDWTGQRIEGLTVHGLGPAIAARIDESEFAQLVRSVSRDRKGTILFAPRVTLFSGQTAVIADQVQRPFVTSVESKADGRIQPVISFVDEGLSLLITPKAGDDDSVTLAFEVKTSSIGKVSYANLPIRTSNNAKPQLTVQVPATEQYAVSSSVKLKVGESIVVAIPRVFDNKPGADAETTVIVTLTPSIIDTRESPSSTETAQ